MKEQDFKIFPTLLRLYSDFMTEEQCKNAVEYIKSNEPLGAHALLEGDGVSSFSNYNSVIDNIEKNVISCAGIKDKFNLIIKNYCEDVGLKDLELTNSWASIQNKGSRLHKHLHHFCSVSGVVYLHTDSDSSRIYFYNPNPYNNLYFKKEYSEYTYEHIWFKPNIGDLFLFPFWLLHGSHEDINNTEGRTIISFSAETKKEYL